MNTRPKTEEPASDWSRVESSITNVVLPRFDGHEKRKHARASVDAQNLKVCFRSKGALAKVYVRDISHGGMYVKTEARPPLNGTLDLTLEAPEEIGLGVVEFSIRARVVRHGSDGIGLSFELGDSDSKRRLETFVTSVADAHGLTSEPERRESSFKKYFEAKDKQQGKRDQRKKSVVRMLIIVALVSLNLVAIHQSDVGTEILNRSSPSKSSQIYSKVHLDNSNQLKEGASSMKFYLVKNGFRVPIDSKEIPPAIKATLNGARQLPAPARRSKTAPDSRVRLK